MSPIETLIKACVDDERMLARGEELLPAKRAVLGRLGETRRVFVDQLTTAGRTLHRTPRVRASWAGGLRRLTLSLRALAGGANSGDTLRACLQSQQRLEARFAAAQERVWTQELQRLLIEQHAEICEARRALLAI